MDRLFIAEKHDVAKAIASVLGITAKDNGAYHCGQDSVTWCAGHMLELCVPEDYNASYKTWRLTDLPIVTIPWRYKTIKGRGKQLAVIKSLMSKATTLVHAGDTDGEGQLLVDEILGHYGNKKPVKRILINDNNERMIKKALANLRDNRDFHGLSQAALARSVGDQLYGFNMTRLYTLKAREKGAAGVFSVGRVQTPILGLIVRRDREIANHTKANFYVVSGEFAINNVTFRAVFRPGSDAPLDDDKRISDESFARTIAETVAGKPATVTTAKTDAKSEPPPLPYDLLELQADASRKFGIKPDQTLKLTQALREKKLITYNRSDCRYLNEEQHEDAPLVLAAIGENAPMLTDASTTAQPAIKGRCFNNRNVTAHHAIIPTEARVALDALSLNEQHIYLLIARQYIAQFYGPRQSKVTTVVTTVERHEFQARSTEIVDSGWSRLYKNDKGNDEVHQRKRDEDVETPLTALKAKDTGLCISAQSDKKETKPPQHYTQATLLKDLKRVAKYVSDPAIAALLRDKDKDKRGEQGGIGTPATRDTFVVKLIERNYVEEKGKKILSTKVGQSFHDALPLFATQPDLTALWYAQQKEIETGDKETLAFIHELVSTITAHVDEIRPGALNITVDGHACPTCNEGVLLRRKGKYGHFWPCNRYPDCSASYPDKRGRPDFAPKKAAAPSEHNCEACDKPLIRRKSKPKKGFKKATYWYGCSGFPQCKKTYIETAGKPHFSATS